MLKIGFLAASAIGLLSCNNVPAGSQNASAPKTAKQDPTVASFLDLSKQTESAYIRRDTKFFESILNENFVATEYGRRISKQGMIEQIRNHTCTVEEGWSLIEPELVRLTDDAFVFSYADVKSSTCKQNGELLKQPRLARTSIVWMRSSQSWEAAFYGRNAVVAPQALSANPAKSLQSRKTSSLDQNAQALMAAENHIWDAWKSKDPSRIGALTASEIAFVNIFGTYYPNKAEVLKDWTGSLCNIKSFRLMDGVATLISPIIGILTLTGTVEGNCGGQKPPKVYGTSVYVKQGDQWMWSFGFNSPDRLKPII